MLFNTAQKALRCPRLSAQKCICRTFSSEVDGAGTSTGIEHALKFKQLGQANKRDFDKEYKCIEYLHFNKYSYYDIEVALHVKELEKFPFSQCKMQQYRAPQPSNKHPDTEPKFKSQWWKWCPHCVYLKIRIFE